MKLLSERGTEDVEPCPIGRKANKGSSGVDGIGIALLGRHYFMKQMDTQYGIEYFR